MTSRRLFSLVFATLVACGGAKPPAPPAPSTPTTTGATATATVPQAPTKGDAVLPLWPEVKKGKLPNGLTYYILQHDKPRSARVPVARGQRGLGARGRRSARPRALRRAHGVQRDASGSRRPTIVNYLEKIGMRFGADLNAYTTSTRPSISSRSRPTSRSSSARASTSCATGPATSRYDPAEVDKERGVVLEEWRLGRGAHAAAVRQAGEGPVPRLALRRPPDDRPAGDHQEGAARHAAPLLQGLVPPRPDGGDRRR